MPYKHLRTGSISTELYLHTSGTPWELCKYIIATVKHELFAELTKGQDMQNPTITPEAVVDAITGSNSGVDGVNQEALDNFNKALLGLMQTMVLLSLIHI